MLIFQRVINWLNKPEGSRKIVRVIIIALLLNLIFGIGFYLTESGVQENLKMSDCIWWAMVTMTTVGYGDFYAQTDLGRFLVSYPAMLVGIGIMGYLIGEIATYLIDKQSRRRRGMVQINKTNHIIICNFPNEEKISDLIDELQATDQHKDCHFVVISDTINEIPMTLSKRPLLFVKGDPADPKILEQANISKSAGLIVLAKDPSNPSSDDKTFVISSIADNFRQQSGAPEKIVLELLSEKNLSIMKKVNADGIVTQERITDKLLVQEFLYPGLQTVFQQLISNLEGSEFYITDTKLIGLKVQDIQIGVLKHPANLQVIGVIREGNYILNPSKKMVIGKGDKLVLLAENREDFASIENDLLKAQNS